MNEVRRAWARCIAALLACVGVSAFAGTTQAVTGTFIMARADLQNVARWSAHFTCIGFPTCNGAYSAIVQDPGCSNSYAMDDISITITGLDLSAPGNIGAQLKAAQNWTSTPSAPGSSTCNYTLGTDAAPSLPFNASWDGARGTMDYLVGIDFTQRRNVIFAAWYTYDASGNPKWYVASNCVTPTSGATSGTCSGPLYEVNGPVSFGAAFNSSLVHVNPAGSLLVNFQNANNASMMYTVGTQTRTVAITRQIFPPGATPAVDYTDLWWNAPANSEPGWGAAISHQAGTIFLAWYVYDPSGKPVWYVASNCVVSGSSCSGALYRTTGPPFGPTFDSTKVRVFQVGNVIVSFVDANNAILSYTVDGASATKIITRQTF